MSDKITHNAEKERLNALHDTQLLDSAAEERFDRITRLASNALNTPIALITLVDQNRQWFKSTHGLDTQETPRNVSFCHHAIKSQDIMVVNDARADVRFENNPLVTGDPHVRFYAGVPLITNDGHALGTLCVIDRHARPDFSDQDRAILKDLAASVVAEIESEKRSQLIDDLSLINEELRHRMGNMYAHVSALIALMGRDEEDTDRLVRRFREKINMMAQTQALLASHNWNKVPLSALIETTLAPFVSTENVARVAIQVQEDFDISPRGAFVLSLMLNELGTNAVKHGALSTHDGKVSFGWSSLSHEISFTWREELPTPRTPSESGTGFGSKILKRIVPMDLQGEAHYELTENGLLYSVTANPERVKFLASDVGLMATSLR